MGTRARVDYDRIAANYDRRYRGPRYDGVENTLRAWLAATRGGRMLEVGCGTGHWLATLAHPRRRWFGLDRSRRMLARAREAAPGAGVAQGDAGSLPFASGSFDALLCMNALHHFPDKPAFLKEAARVLAAGGQFRSVGLDPHEGTPRWAIYDYFEGTREADLGRYPARAEILAWLETAGFVDCATEVAQRIRTRQPALRALESPIMRRDGTSQLALLSDAAYARGVQRIRDAAARAEAEGSTLYLEADLLLFATSGRRA